MVKKLNSDQNVIKHRFKYKWNVILLVFRNSGSFRLPGRTYSSILSHSFCTEPKNLQTIFTPLYSQMFSYFIWKPEKYFLLQNFQSFVACEESENHIIMIYLIVTLGESFLNLSQGQLIILKVKSVHRIFYRKYI